MKKMKLFSAVFFMFCIASVIYGTDEKKTADEMKTAETSANPTVISLCSPEAFADFDFSLTDGASRDEVYSLTDDGILEINGKKFGFLATKATYKNFTIRGEYALGSAQTNTGFLVRVTGPSQTFLPRCVEIQMMTGESGDLFGFHGLVINGTADRFESDKNHEFAGDYCWVHAFRQTEKPVGEWNQIEITCFEDFVLVRINGAVVNWATGVENVAGHVAFQSEGGPVHWRNVTLIEE